MVYYINDKIFWKIENDKNDLLILVFFYGFGGGLFVYEWLKVYFVLVLEYCIFVFDLIGWGCLEY